MSVRIADKRVKEENVRKTRIRQRGLACHVASRRKIPIPIACERRACRAKATLELREPIGNMIKPDRLGNLRGVEFGIRLKAGIRRAFHSSLEQDRRSAQTPPTFREHAVRRQLWRSRSHRHRSVAARKRHVGQGFRERIGIEVYALPEGLVIVFRHPMDVIQRKTA